MTRPFYRKDDKVCLWVYDYLETATPEERTETVLKLIEGHPEGRLDLPGRDGKRANLDGVDLGRDNITARVGCYPNRPKWATEASHERYDANLRFARLEGATLKCAHLEAARLVGADLQGSILMEALLEGADLRRIHLEDAHLEDAHMEGSFLWYAHMEGADVRDAHLERARLGSTHLEHANLAGAHLSGMNPSGAWLTSTRFAHTQLGGSIAEESERDYSKARDGYLNLKQNFQSLGDYDGASWAYRRERCMGRHETLEAARLARSENGWRTSINLYAKAHGYHFVELLCDYGEGWRNIIGCIAFFWVFFALLYGLNGYVLTPGTPEATTISASTAQQGSHYVATPSFFHWMAFSLATMVTIELKTLGPSSHPVMNYLMPLQALIGIFLAGLLGFVAGNRIRRS